MNYSPDVVTVGKLDAHMLEEFVSLWDIRDDRQAQSSSTAAQSNGTAAQSNNTAVQSNGRRISSRQRKQNTSKHVTTRTKGVIYKTKTTIHEGGSPSVEEKEKSATEYPEFQSFYQLCDEETSGAGRLTDYSFPTVLRHDIIFYYYL